MIPNPSSLRVLFVSAMYPHPGNEGYGAFVMQQAEAVRSLGYEVDVIDFPGYRSKVEYLKACVRVFRQTRRRRYSVVHAHYGMTGLVGMFKNSIPLVITVHGSDALVGWFEPLVTKAVARRADATIVVSRKIAGRIPGEIIPCGVDLSLFSPKSKLESRLRLGIPAHRKYVLFPFKTNRAVKRFDLAAAAVQQLAREGLDIELLTVSDVHFSEMPWYYSAADAMILCSDSEGSPTSVKEALACNLPVVSVDVGDVREILNKIDGAEIVERTADALAGGIKRVFRHSEQFAFVGRRAMEAYSQVETAKAIVRVYADAIQRRKESRLAANTAVGVDRKA